MIFQTFTCKGVDEFMNSGEQISYPNTNQFIAQQNFAIGGYWGYNMFENTNKQNMNLTNWNCEKDSTTTANWDKYCMCQSNVYYPCYVPGMNNGYLGFPATLPAFPMTLNQLSNSPEMRNMEDQPIQKKRSRPKKDFNLPCVLNGLAINGSEISRKINNTEFKITENPHYLRPFKNLANEFRKNHKGRKRRCYLEAQHIKEFLEDYVTPQWNLYVETISERERSIGIINKGQKYAWVQFFKDIMKFYRLIFRLRYHRCDKRRDNNQEPLVKGVLAELGIECDSYDYYEVFSFFYSVLNKLRKNPASNEEEKGNRSFSKVFDEDTQENIEGFINHPLSRKLLIFFIVNFGKTYSGKMQGSFKKEAGAIITYLSTEYSINLESKKY